MVSATRGLGIASWLCCLIIVSFTMDVWVDREGGALAVVGRASVLLGLGGDMVELIYLPDG